MTTTTTKRRVHGYEVFDMLVREEDGPLPSYRDKVHTLVEHCMNRHDGMDKYDTCDMVKVTVIKVYEKPEVHILNTGDFGKESKKYAELTDRMVNRSVRLMVPKKSS